MTDRCTIIFHPADLLPLLTAATDGLVPPDARLLEVGQHPYLSRILALVAESSAWRSPAQIQFRFNSDGEILVYDGEIEPLWHPAPLP